MERACFLYYHSRTCKQQFRTRAGHTLSDPDKAFRFYFPKDLDIKAPVFIGLQEPVEVIPIHPIFYVLSDQKQKKIITISGQIVNGTGRDLLLKSFKAILKSGKLVKKVIFNKDLPFAFFESSDTSKPIQVDSVTPSNNPILGFLFLFEVPYDFSDGILTIKAKYAFTNPNNEKLNYVEVSHNADVELAPLSKMKAPIGKVKGSWKWGNGPGVPYFTTHSRPEARYSYDLVVLKKGVTHYSHSDISDNKSFFCFDRPIVCMHEGEVIEVKDDVPDNNGLTAHPMGPNSVIVVHHGSAKRKMNRYSKYYHIKYNSAKVKEGDFVSPDQILAKVGNSGYSSEPHLHIGYFMIDSTGRLRALPMTFKNLYLHPIDDYPFWSQKVSGVPTGDRKYFVS